MNIINVLLSELEVKHTHSFVEKLFNEHPYKNNLYGLKMILNDFGILGTGIRVKEKSLEKLTYPCILHIGNDFVIGQKFENGELSYLWEGKKTKKSTTEFNQIWSGYALVVETAENTIEPDYKEHQNKELINFCKHMLLWALPAFLILIEGIRNSVLLNSFKTLFLLFSIIGLALGILLMQKQLFEHSNPADKICSLFHQKDCNNVLHTNASKLFGLVSWSEIGTAYFASCITIVCVIPQTFNLLSIVSWCAMGYGIWSVWYQARIVRQWCMLCLLVQGALWINGIVCAYAALLNKNSLFYNISIQDAFLFLLFFSIPLLYIHSWSDFIIKLKDKDEVNQKIRALKSDEKAFIALLHEQEYHQTSHDDSIIILGNLNADIQVTLFSNPHCNPCARMHNRAMELLKKAGDKICIRYIYSYFNNDMKNSNRFLIAAYQQLTHEKAMQIYDMWYTSGKYKPDEVIKEIAVDINTPEVEEEMNKHAEWKTRTKLNATPTLLVNGYLLPANYEIEDLYYLKDFI